MYCENCHKEMKEVHNGFICVNYPKCLNNKKSDPRDYELYRKDRRCHRLKYLELPHSAFRRG